jgi:hypothetical protein
MDQRIFRVSGEANVQCMHIGRELEPLLKVGSLMAGVDDIKKYAIEKNDFTVSDSYYPGVRMSLPDDYVVSVVRHLKAYIEKFFGYDLRQLKSAASRFSMVTQPASSLSLLQRIPHFDAPSKKSLAMVHYLCDGPDSGTAMYRHSELGYEFIDRERYQTYMQAIQRQFPTPDSYPEGYIYKSTNEFEQIESFQAVYNQLIVYRGSSLHSGVIRPNYTFDPSPATGRLTITTFIEFE